MKKNCLISLVCLIFVLSCATVEVGKKFDTAAANKIEIGKTTEGEVLTWLGEPLQKITKEDGSKTYGYGYREGKVTALPFVARGTATGDKLVIGFNPQGIVSSVERGMLPGEGRARRRNMKPATE